LNFLGHTLPLQLLKRVECGIVLILLIKSEWGHKNEGYFSFATAVGILLGASAAQAATVVDNFSGTFGNGVGAVSGQITLDVVAGKAISGSGFIDISNLALSNAPLVTDHDLDTGNETAGGPAYPVGFRANDGTDLFGLDQKFPLDTAGLLFDVGTATAVWGKYPLINLASGAGNSVFDGKSWNRVLCCVRDRRPFRRQSPSLRLGR